MDSVHIRTAGRFYLRAPVLTFCIVASIAISSGAAACVVGVLDAVWWQILPNASVGPVVVITKSSPDGTRRPLTWTDLLRVRGESQSPFAVTGASTNSRLSSVTINGTDVVVAAKAIEPAVLTVLGLKPITGRVFLHTDTGEHVAAELPLLVTNHFWRRYATDRARRLDEVSIRFNGRPAVIVGVIPDDMREVQNADVFTNLVAPVWT